MANVEKGLEMNSAEKLAAALISGIQDIAIKEGRMPEEERMTWEDMGADDFKQDRDAFVTAFAELLASDMIREGENL